MKHCPKLFVVIFITLLFVLSAKSVNALTTTSITPPSVGVTARVGEYYLNLTGYASPFASIVLTSNGVFYRSTTADEKGYWVIKDILINKNFSDFCLEHIDYKNLGNSIACITIPPAKGNITRNDIFLPPTIALQRSQISAGGSAVIFGYSMPYAMVTIHASDGKTYTVKADGNGYYELTIENLKAGVYELYATATYQGKDSEKPVNTVKLTALSWWQQIIQFIMDILKWIIDRLKELGLGPLLLLFPLIPLIIWLILKIWPEAFTSIYENRIFIFLNPHKKKLHHAWFMGY